MDDMESPAEAPEPMPVEKRENARTRQDPRLIADQAGLRYVSDSMPGITRRRSGTGFSYRDPVGHTIRDPKVRKRLTQLVIPPAWTDVWICPDPDGHLQATGRDARGRKQYRYHPRWREMQDHSKFGRMIVFGMSLPRMRERIEQDLGQRGLPRTRVLAAALRILDTTPIRVGNERYMRDNGSFGLTTMRDRHVDLSNGMIRFRFRGKSGKDHVVGLADPDVARVIRRCTETPGSELFTYLNEDGRYASIDSEDLNEYIKQISGYDFTAKDFRTWAGTVRTVTVLSELGAAESASERKKKGLQAVKFVAADLGNTPATCRSYYIHPGVLDAYDKGRLLPLLSQLDVHEPPVSAAGLRREEWPVLALLPRLDALALLEEPLIDEDLGETLRVSVEKVRRKAS
jgi:DNA topoisomerase-1